MRDSTVLIVDDDDMLRDAVQRKLEGERYTTLTAATGQEALDILMGSGEKPDLVLLDIMLPDMEGTSICQQLRQDSSIPVIMLTARNEEADRILGLELGADDYITKPFSPRELVARVKAVLRRVEAQAQPAAGETLLSAAGVTLDLNSRDVTVDGSPVDLTPTQMRLLQILMQQPGRVFSTDELLESVWDYRQYDPHLVETHISNLRNRIETDPKAPRRIITVRSFR